ncbi:MAG: peptide chain release factor N(5)-glutamine methyltransferase [Candidatus Eremiobacteraeota bacterium]|nr:peptide chain release factor N(5)-glutamine methyltransferase [Candidatus Eremiobacteraeota bacterium]
MRSPDLQSNRAYAHTIAGAIETCRRKLIGISGTPWLDARLLASHVTGLDASAIVAYGEHALPAQRRKQLEALTLRRAAGEPVAYLVGFKEFAGIRIGVDHRVLVPRPETEELVELVAHDWHGRNADILDLGTGSGAIACALAHLLTDAAFVASDVNREALDVAAHNVERFALAERVELIESDLFGRFAADRRFDGIVANLPYVADGDPDLAADVERHEPALALRAGPDGLAVYRRMFERAPQHLRAGGRIYCECGPATARGLAEIAARAFPEREIGVYADRGGRERAVIVA